MAELTPRQYRPTYSYLPATTAKIRLSVGGSTSSVTQPAPTYNRRRTTNNFLSIDPLHSHPTVAASGITAASNDISHPRNFKPSNLPRRQSSTPIQYHACHERGATPTRIPTPISNAELVSQIRVVSSSSLLPERMEIQTQHIRQSLPAKENIPVAILRPLTKSRTMNALHTVRSALTRSTHDLKTLASPKRSSSTPTKSSLNINVSVVASSSLPLFITNVRQVSTAMPSCYWAGRFTALYDRFRAEILACSDLLDSPFFRKLLLAPDKVHIVPPFTTNGRTFDFEATEHLKQARRAFIHLEALCLTPEAMKSLTCFRVGYARKMGNEELMPKGMRLNDSGDDGKGIIARAGRLFSGGAGRSSSFEVLKGRKSSFGLGERVDGVSMGCIDV